MRPPRAGFSSMMSQGRVLPHIPFVNEMMEYYTSRIEQNELQISFSSTLLLSALSLGLLHHMFLHYPHQAPVMVTLSFILFTNIFFLVLIIHHNLTNSISFPQNLISPFFLASLAYTGTTLLLKCIYNLIRHNSIPGPLLWRLTDFTYAYHAVKGDLHHQLLSMHQKYGPIIRIQPNHISFSSPAAHNEIYGFKTVFIKGAFYTQILSDFAKCSIVSAISDQAHGRLKRILGTGFTNSALAAVEPNIKVHVMKLMNRLHENSLHGPVDLAKWFPCFSFDVGGDLSLGESFETLDREDNWYLFDAVVKAVKLLEGIPWIMQPLKLIPEPRFVREGRTKVFEYTADLVKRHIEEKETKQDILSFVVKAKDPITGTIFDFEELQLNAQTLLAASSDTTAGALSYAGFFLLKFPNTFQALACEIRQEFSKVEEITQARLVSLPYLTAVIKEALRMRPPVPTGLQRISPKGGATIQGHYIPENTTVSASLHVLQNDPANFASPEQFIPERWLEGSKSSYGVFNSSAFTPFSSGDRQCIGKNLAWLEMRLVLAHFVFLFDAQLVEGSDPGYNYSVVIHPGPVMVNLTRVKTRGDVESEKERGF